MRVKLLSDPHIEYSSEACVPDHCTFDFENEDGAVGMVIIGGRFGNDHPMPKAKGETVDLTGQWQHRNVFIADALNQADATPADGVMREAQKAATALMELRTEDDENIRNIAQSVLRMANYASPAEYAILREMPETWLRRIEDDWLSDPAPRNTTVHVGNF